MTALILFDDAAACHLEPLALTRPGHDLRLGLETIGERWRKAIGAKRATGLVKPHLKGLFPEPSRSPSEAIWINARYLPTPALVKTVRASAVVCQGDDLVAARATASQSAAWFKAGRPEPRGRGHQFTPPVPVVRYPWDLVRLAPDAIAAEAAAVEQPAGPGPGFHAAAFIDRPDRLFMHPAAVVEPGAILVAEEGPILLGESARVMAGAMLRGPVAVGDHAIVRMAARIYGGTVIGPHCRVGGEVAASIFHSYSNKSHEGYVGNSVFGQWVNLGADTTASNLKMTYGSVKLLDWPTGLEVDTGEQFVGTVMGDHSKTGINTMLNTGTVCGVSAILVGAGFPPREIPSFKWVQPGAVTDYRLDKAIVDMERMMARRGVPLTPAYRRMMTAIYEMGRG